MKNKTLYTILTMILILSSLLEGLDAQILPMVAKEQETPILLVGWEDRIRP